MSVNTNNFGVNNTSVSGECHAIFQEAQGNSCLDSPAMCEGSCIDFTSTTCSLPMYDKFVYGPVSSVPGSSPMLGENAPPNALDKVQQPESSNNLIPIIVATVVSAFVVFGLAGIIWHRKKKGTGGSGGGGGMRSTVTSSNPFSSMRKSNQAQEEGLNDAYDGFDDLDEEDGHYR